MRLGIDFDNTIVCYDALFHRVAREDGVIPADLPANKSDVRNHLRAVGREEVWTAMQGRVYGARMAEADPYPGVLEFLLGCRRRGVPFFIISHKTRRPFVGESHDLHAAALDWLERQGFFDPHGIGLSRDQVCFELTKAEKLQRIAACGCTHFIDDLPEFLAEAAFPGGVERWLFDPNDLYSAETRFHRFRDWPQAAGEFGLIDRRSIKNATPIVPNAARPSEAPPSPAFPTTSASSASSTSSVLLPEFSAFLAGAGLPPVTACEPLPGGANNRVYLLRAGNRAYVLKRYFHDAADPRDRFGAERAFYTWAWSRGVRRVPEPCAWDPARRLGLFEYIPGRKLVPGEPDTLHLEQALALVAEVNTGRQTPAATRIPVASEACFSIAEHAERLDARVLRLERMEPTSEVDHLAADLVRRELAPRWRTVRESMKRSADFSVPPLTGVARCLSPSDFGFHNALLPADGRFRFLDFEYAGWDDPAKLIGDFFCQPQVPVPFRFWTLMVEGLDSALQWNGRLAARSELLLPAYRLKWCCILLNEFLRTDRARREFALGDTSDRSDAVEARKRAQLDKVRALLAASR